MPEMHLRQPGFTYSACGTLNQKLRETKKKRKKIGDSRYIYQNKLDKACFQHNMTYEDFNDLKRRKAAGKTLHDTTFIVVKNPTFDGYQCGIASVVYILFDKKASGGAIKKEIISNKKNSRIITQTNY